MKNYNLLLTFVVCAVSFCSCSNEDETNPISNELVPMTFEINLNEPETRAYIDGGYDHSSGTQDVIWKDGDKVKVFAKGHTDGYDFTYSNWIEYKHTGVFTGDSYNETDYYGIYPAKSCLSIQYEGDNGMIKCEIPSTQNATVGTFDPDAAILVGHAQNWSGKKSLDLKHICAFFAIKVGEGCRSVVIQTGNHNWPIAGKVTAEVGSGTAKIASKDDCTYKIVLTNESVLANGGTFLIPFIPSSEFPRFSVSVNFDNNKNKQADYTTSGTGETFQFNTGGVYELGTFTKDAQSYKID